MDEIKVKRKGWYQFVIKLSVYFCSATFFLQTNQVSLNSSCLFNLHSCIFYFQIKFLSTVMVLKAITDHANWSCIVSFQILSFNCFQVIFFSLRKLRMQQNYSPWNDEMRMNKYGRYIYIYCIWGYEQSYSATYNKYWKFFIWILFSVIYMNWTFE